VWVSRWRNAPARDRRAPPRHPLARLPIASPVHPVACECVTRSPPLVPAFDIATCIVFDDFRRFRVYRETDENEGDRETVIRNIINGQYEKPVRVVAFNTADG
jgi:hypothetical protein